MLQGGLGAVFRVNYIILLMIKKSCISLRTLNYGNSGILFIMGNAGFISSTVGAIGSLYQHSVHVGLQQGSHRGISKSKHVQTRCAHRPIGSMCKP